MNKEKKKQYEAPDLTAVTFRNEHGYALSMKFNALAQSESADLSNEYMEAERTDYGTATNYNWF